jgi:hypothetical protein
MNEKIKLLAEQAYLYQEHDTFLIAALENFAELIVEECAGLVDQVIMEDGTRRGDFIRKHFGVEE